MGGGVVRLLHENASIIAARAGQPITVAAVCARDRARERGLPLDGIDWVQDPSSLATLPGIDAVVELIGGAGNPARALVTACLAAGRPVVTANKALLAIHGATLPRSAALGFEAAVGGGIPIIKALREGLAANQISRLAGILNGTCNYILSAMHQQRREFADILAEAQAQGYAETDPATDIDGVDAAHKLAILAALAFGHAVCLDAVYVEGIRRISALDIAFAEELGCRIKLLGIARRTEQGVEARVHPCLVPSAAPIARVEGVFNAVVVEGNAAGRVMLEGRGAGAGPTASAVVSDLIDVARRRLTPTWGQEMLLETTPVPIGEHVGAFYLRLMVTDRPGVIADVAAILRDHGVSLESLLQHGRSPQEAVPVVLVTHDVRERDMYAAAERIALLPAVLEPPALIRIEPG